MIVLSHTTALEFWRDPRWSTTAFRYAKTAASWQWCASCAVEAEDCLPAKLSGLTRPLELLVAPTSRRHTAQTKGRSWHGALQPRMFCRVDERCLVSSPAFCLLQMAAQSTLVETLQLGFEFCGNYAMRPDDARGFMKRDKLLDVESSSQFFASIKGSNGIKAARRASRYLLEGSASPMETSLALLLTLPVALGGYGLSGAVLNACCGTRYCDISWLQQGIAVEYDSDEFHTGSDRIFRDGVRRNEIVGKGIRTVTVTRQQIKDPFEMERVARLLAKMMGKRLSNGGFEMSKRRCALRRELFPFWRF